MNIACNWNVSDKCKSRWEDAVFVGLQNLQILSDELIVELENVG